VTCQATPAFCRLGCRKAETIITLCRNAGIVLLLGSKPNNLRFFPFLFFFFFPFFFFSFLSSFFLSFLLSFLLFSFFITWTSQFWAAESRIFRISQKPEPSTKPSTRLVHQQGTTCNIHLDVTFAWYFVLRKGWDPTYTSRISR
jgi:hypothetical protein